MIWKRSSHCESAECVEVWRKSSYSTPNGQCVETKLMGDIILVRDSKDADGDLAQLTLAFTRAEWRAFIAGVKDGEFDI